jgi:hypothetical protein
MFTVILLLAVSLIYNSSYTFHVFAAPKDPRFDNGDCTNSPETLSVTCCWKDYFAGYDDKPFVWKTCQTCYIDTGTGEFASCDNPYSAKPLPTGDLPQAEIVPPVKTLPGGDIKTLEQVPLEQVPPLPGGDLPTLQQVPTLEPGPGLNQGTEGEPPLPVICSEEAGLEKDPETGQCVPIEPEAPEQPEEVEEPPEKEQPSEGEDSSNN